MNTMKIHEQITFLRKQKGLTQEELAKALGVSNQAVSKWESGQCCPDIQLLPSLADFFEVSIDELLGRKHSNTLGEICLSIKDYFTALPEKASFEHAYRLAALLHEIAVTDGYKKYIPWQSKDYSTDSISSWGLSASSEAEGITVRNNSSIFFSYSKETPSLTVSQLHELSLTLKSFTDIRVLKVMYVLYNSAKQNSEFRLTIGESSGTGHLHFSLAAGYLSVNEIAALTQLSIEDVNTAFEKLPLLTKEEQGKLFFRLDDFFLPIPALLMLLLTLS